MPLLCIRFSLIIVNFRPGEYEKIWIFARIILLAKSARPRERRGFVRPVERYRVTALFILFYLERRFGKEELGMGPEDAHVRLPALVESTRRTIFNEFPVRLESKGNVGKACSIRYNGTWHCATPWHALIRVIDAMHWFLWSIFLSFLLLFFFNILESIPRLHD